MIYNHEPISDKDPDKYALAAKQLVSIDYSQHHVEGEDETDSEDFYIVWFVKVLGNWKAMVSTDLESGLYWEVTFNGNTGQAYVDEYRKHHNQAIPFSFA